MADGAWATSPGRGQRRRDVTGDENVVSHVRRTCEHERIADPRANRRLHRQPGNVRWGDPGSGARLSPIRARPTGHGAGPEQHDELLAHLAGHRSDDVTRIGVEPAQAGHVHDDAGLLGHLTGCGGDRALTDVDAPAG